MRLPHIHSTTRRVILAIAILICLVMTHWAIVETHMGPFVYVPVSVVVASLFALGAMRRPWYFLAIAALLWMLLPDVYDSSAHDMFSGSYVLGWIMGTPTSMFMKHNAGRPEAPESVAPG